MNDTIDTLHPADAIPGVAPRWRGSLRYVRHGATAPNLAHVRCGGDLDVPLHELGREQAHAIALSLVDLQPEIGLIISSDLRRTRETARIIADRLGGPEVLVIPGFAERRLGEWNLLSIEETQAWLDEGRTPPGGESDQEFALRVGRACQAVKPWLHRHPLLVGSKGVARILGRFVGLPTRLDLRNAQLTEFRLADLPCLETTWGALS